MAVAIPLNIYKKNKLFIKKKLPEKKIPTREKIRANIFENN